jgi:hypothetical protein
MINLSRFSRVLDRGGISLTRLMPTVLILVMCAAMTAHALPIRIDDSSDTLAVTSDSAIMLNVEGQPPFDLARACAAFPTSFASLNETGTFVAAASTSSTPASQTYRFSSDRIRTRPSPN